MMSTWLRGPTQRNEANLERQSNTSRFSNILSRIRNLCSCASQNDENINPVRVVDSVRLVYMRQIEEANALYHTMRINNRHTLDELQVPPPRLIRHRGRSGDESTLQALEKALKEYELKNKVIISNTSVPDARIKASKISRSSQTVAQFIADLQKAVDEEIDKISATSVEIRHVSYCITDGESSENVIVEHKLTE